ncbi:MAG: ABC transporter substrate-binding protein [Chloroflexota bacterium]
MASVAFAVAACSSAGQAAPGSSQPASPTTAVASLSAAASSSASPAGSAVVHGSVRLALDWTPNTNHAAFYVAQANGWYRDGGVDLRILPYSGTAPETLLTAHQADCGISFQDALTFAVAAGSPIVSVMAILQHAGSEIAVLESSGITRPRQLDGKTYAGFGYPNEEPTVRSVIQHDGGKGTFRAVTADTAAYEALYAKRADFTITFRAQEGVEAAQRNIKLRYFAFTDYGFPDFYQVVLACDRQWLSANPELARAFVGATMRGLDVAATDPNAAADALISQNPGVFDSNPALPRDSAQFLAAHRLLVDGSGRVGIQTLGEWTGYSSFLYGAGLLADANGKPLKSPPDYSSLFTNDYLPPE